MAFTVFGKGKTADQLFNSTEAGSILYLGAGEGCYFHISESKIASGKIDLNYKMDCTLGGSFQMFLSKLSAAFNGDEQKYFQLQSTQEIQNFNYDPFEDWVMIIPYSDNTDLGLEKGKPVMLPAIGAHFLFKEKSNQVSRLAFRTVLNLVSIATGASALSGSGHIARVLGIIDITTTSADLTLDLFSEDLIGLLGQENYNALRTGTGIIQLAGIGGLGVIKTKQIVDNLPKLYDKIKNTSWDFTGLGDAKATALRRVVGVFGGELEEVTETMWKSGWNKERVLSYSKGLRPDPVSYLKNDYITDHLKKFEGGVTKFSPKNPYGKVGPPSGTFVMPKSIADDLILRSEGDISKLEDLLGLERGYLGTNPYRIDIESPSGLRMSDGNELGANEFWIPGGNTSGGIPEATVDQILEGTYIKSTIY